MMKIAAFVSCLCACAFAQTVTNCDSGPSITATITDVIFTNANPIHLLSQAFQVSANLVITGTVTADDMNQATLVIDAVAKHGFFSEHVCKDGVPLVGCTLSFCGTLGADVCAQIVTGPQTITLKNQSFGPITSLPTWLSNLLKPLSPVTLTLSAKVMIAGTEQACVSVSGLTVDIN